MSGPEDNKPTASEPEGLEQEDIKVSMKTELFDEAVGWAKTIIFAVVFALLINSFIIVNASVPTGSMENNIMPGDRIVAFRLSYQFSEPKRFDIVVFRFPKNETELFVKRVIGLPGDTLEIRSGKVYINGAEEPLADDFIKSLSSDNFGPCVVPEGRYFMMGDNRINSDDSRYWGASGEPNDPIRFVAKEKILGKVLFKYFRGFKMLYNL